MTQKTRSILFYIFILCFVSITPLVWLYAAGYQIGTNLKFQKTGILVIKTTPKSANIYLDKIKGANSVADLLFEKNYTTPAKIKSLLPGEYNVKLEKDGYWPWNKKLNINGGESVYVENVFFFKNNLPIAISNKEYSKIIPSADKQLLLALGNNGADIINLNNDKIINLSLATTSPKIIIDSTNSFWLSNSKVIVGNFLFNLENINAPINLNDAISEKFLHLQPDLSNSSKIFYQTKNYLASFNLDGTDKPNSIITKQPIANFFVRDNTLYFISQENGSSVFNIFDVNGKKSIRKINLPYSNYEFINKNNNLINLLDNDHKLLYLIDPLGEIKPILETISNVNKASWIDENILILANDFEIWTFDLRNYQKNLITRIGEEIKNILPFINSYYIFYTTDKTINAIELDPRDKNQILKLAGLDEISDPFIDDASENIYFYSKINNTNGVYKLVIQ